MRLIARGVPLARLAGVFVSGQIIVQIVNMSVGIILLHLLSVHDYAFYTIGVTMAVVAAMVANPGMSHWLITAASQVDGDRGRMKQLALTVRRRSRWFLLFGAPVIVALTMGMLWRGGWPLGEQLLLAAIVLVMGFLRIDTVTVGALLNVSRRAKGLFWVGFIEAAVRLILTPLSWLFPLGVLAVAVNAVGVFLASRYSLHLFKAFGGPAASSPALEDGRRLTQFLVPLAPMNLYNALQGQISVLLLGLVGKSTLIAQYGAVTRLSQIILIVSLLNPFLVQPSLASQKHRVGYVRRLGLILVALAALGTILIGSSLLTPKLWLFVLGRKYEGVGDSLVWMVSTAMVSLVGGVFYTAVIARGETRGQYLSIIPSLALQGVFLAVTRLSTLTDALLLMLIPGLLYAITQGGLLFRTVWAWRD